MARFAFIDDDHDDLALMKIHTKSFNSHGVYDRVEASYYSDHRQFLADHAINPFDCVVLDFRLGHGVTGADVMNSAIGYNESTIFIVVSASFKDSLRSLSFIPKTRIKFSEIFHRFNKLKDNWLYNVAEINIRLAENPEIFGCQKTT